ncbi:glycoside hydrolase [Mollisia scopiformis]|uniref:Glycoside hydrolase n=1 Tax=Mollisia scopiformis TaxID=149040 RepID=A0A194X821_MOLSC|nr:glycoside hydrolase [Mollisia scopiformis]KUJ16313.1 glycoside hydrolase [Mollisia scopiformis]
MASTSKTSPHLQSIEKSQQLMVNGKPFLMLGAELQNSSMTSPAYMDTVWQKLVDTHINTVLGCVTWEDIEPVEGKFDFSELDKVIEGARAHGLHLVLLWFGSFKNGLSSYTPSWVKKDVKRFPRAHLRKSGGILQTADVVSIFHTEARDADTRAFSTLMRHVKEIDAAHGTVIMTQVENETGLLGDSRDGSSAANKKFSEPVPKDLVEHLSSKWDSLSPDLRANLQVFKGLGQKSGSWESVFGKSKQTDELFMAYHYALYVNHVAAAGKKKYNIPLYTNVWQNYVGSDDDNAFPVIAGGGGEPGDYPSGGGVSNVLDIWKTFAPSLDFIAPDIYLNDYSASCKKYRHLDQPLFIPEQRRDEYGARRIWKAFGSFQAIGTSPFGIDTLEPETNPFTRHYKLLSQVKDIVLETHRKPGSSIGFFFDELLEDGRDPSPPTIARFGDFEVTIKRCFVFGKPGSGAGMLIHQGDGKFLLIGWGFQAEFKSKSPKSTFTGILNFTEKMMDKETGKLITGKKLNGDETRSGKYLMMPNEDPDYGGFPICVTIPARTMIAECEVYSLEEGSGDL